MAPIGEDHGKKVGRKLTKKWRPSRHHSMHYPECLQPGPDAQEDVTAPKGNEPHYLNQSVFSMIAAAGSKSEFHAKFNDESSGSEEETEVPELPKIPTPGLGRPSKSLHGVREENVDRTSVSRSDSRRRFESKLRKSLPRLNLRTNKEKNYMSRSSILPTLNPGKSPTVATPRDAPVMTRMLEARAQLDSSTAELENSVGMFEAAEPGESSTPENVPTSLSTRLMEIFGLEKPEEVVSGLSAIPHYLYILLIAYQNTHAGSSKAFFSKVTCILRHSTSVSTPTCQRNP